MTWKIFDRNRKDPDDKSSAEALKKLETHKAPTWRVTGESGADERGKIYHISEEAELMINAALYLRRPLLVTGKPGTGKTTLAYAVARQLDLGEVLKWPISTRSTLREGLYEYDAIGRLQAQNLANLRGSDQEKQTVSIEDFIQLGPLGTAMLPSSKPRVLLVDEIDKSDLDLPNDLLSVFEDGYFRIPELLREKDTSDQTYTLRTHYTKEPKDKEEDPRYYKHNLQDGDIIRCDAYPFIVLSSNGERDFPPAFLRRCIRLDLKPPERDVLKEIAQEYLKAGQLNYDNGDLDQLINKFLEKQEAGTLATDQLLNAIYMAIKGQGDDNAKKDLIEQLLRPLDER